MALTGYSRWERSLHAAPDPKETVPALERKKAGLAAKAKEYQQELDELMVRCKRKAYHSCSQC